MKSNKEWQSWGKTDPLWSVASWSGKQRGGPSPWTAEEFLALGAADFKDVRRHWEHFGLERGTCVEIGCGAGRMTAQLAATFANVVALDVSDDQIKLAKELLGARADNVTFVQVSDATIPLSDGSSAAMFSSHVFQHFPGFVEVARYLQETFRVLRSGGTVCFHIPVVGAHLSSPASPIRLALHNAATRARRLVGMLKVMEYHRYSAHDVFSTLQNVGFSDAELRIFPMTSNGDAHSFFFARRP